MMRKLAQSAATVFLIFWAYSILPLSFGLEEYVCGGVDMRNSPEAFLRSSPGLAELVALCTVIEGDVHLILMVDGNLTDERFELIRFPRLREITGYLMIFQLKVLTSLAHVFPELRVIRGETLIHNYAFVMYQNADMAEIGLPKLTEISKGGVRIYQNPNLCYADTINWREISKEPPFLDHNKQPNMCFDGCKVTPDPNRTKDKYNVRASLDDVAGFDGCSRRPEPHSNMTACWNAHTCQKTCPVHCKSQGLACSDTGPDPVCCHPECIGGCSGLGDQNCYACRNVYHDNRCLPACPPDYYKYKGRRCLTRKECESKQNTEFSFTSDDTYYKAIDLTRTCSLTCPQGHEEDPDDVRKCRPCPVDTGCTKRCRSPGNIQSVSDAQQYKGCNVLLSSLEIEIHSGMSKNVVQTLFEHLRDLKEVTGFVKISFTPSFVALDFLKNLRLIQGKELYRQKYALSVLGNANLARLWDPMNHLNDSTQTLTIQRGGVQFHNNHQLCYSTIMEFLQSINMSENVTEHDVSKNSNGERAICEKNKLQSRIVYTTFDIVVCAWKPFNTSTLDHRLFLGYQIYYKKVRAKVLNIYEKRDACSDSWEMKFEAPGSVGVAIRHLTPNSLYAVYIRTLMVDSAGSGAISDVMYAKTKFQAPSEVVFKSAKSLRPDAIELSWDPPEMPNGQVTHYMISYAAKVENLPRERDYCVEPPDYNKPNEESTDDDPFGMDSTSGLDPALGTCPASGNCCKCSDDDQVMTPRVELTGERFRVTREKVAFENAIHNALLMSSRNPEFERTSTVDQTGSKRTKRLVKERINHEKNSTHAVAKLDSYVVNKPERLLGSLTLSTEPTRPVSSHFAIYSKRNGLAMSQTNSRVFNVSALNFTLIGLKHFTSYEIKIWACQNVSVPESSCSNAPSYRSRRTQMIEDKDTVDLRSVEIIDEPTRENAPQKRILWKPPPDPNGLVVAYEVEYSRDASPKIAPKTECITVSRFNESLGILLSDLLPGNYSVRIRAITLAQRGPQTQRLFFVIPQTFRFSTTAVALVAICCALAALVLGVLLVAALYRRWISKKYPEYLMGIFSANPDYISQIQMYQADEWELNRDSVELLDEIGRGSFGTVYKGRGLGVRSVCGAEFGDCAVKTVAKTATLYDRFHFLTEASIMKSMHTYHVVKLYGVVSENRPVLVVMEYMAEGNLKEHLMKRRPENNSTDHQYEPPTLLEALRMACQIADGMAYLAAKKFCHRDLAARNCMVAADRTVKIGDFGMTRDVQTKDYYKPSGRRLMPVRWMSPEAIEFARFTTQSDVWSYGVVLWEIVTLASQPYPGLSNEEVRKFVVEDRLLMKMPVGCPGQLWDLITRCWQYNPADRPSFDDIVADLLPCMEGTSFDLISYYHTQRGTDLGEYDDGLASVSTAASALNAKNSEAALPSAAVRSKKRPKSRRGIETGWFDRYVMCFYPSSSLFEQHLQHFEGADEIKLEKAVDHKEAHKKTIVQSNGQFSPKSSTNWSMGLLNRLGSLIGPRAVHSRPATLKPTRTSNNCSGLIDKTPHDQGALLPTTVPAL